MYARTRTLGTTGSGCNGAGAGGCTTGAAVSSVKSIASPETPACGADGCPTMGAAPDGSCTPTHKQGMDGMGRTPTIMIPGCFAKARRRISKATRCEQPLTLCILRTTCHLGRDAIRVFDAFFTTAGCVVLPYQAPCLVHPNPSIHVNKCLSAHRRMQSDGNIINNKLAAPLPARPVLKKMLVPGAVQSPPFLLAVVGQPTVVDGDCNRRTTRI